MPGEPGTWVVVFGDLAVFSLFFATFLVERGKSAQVFETGHRTLHTGIGLTNTLVLLTSSLLVVIAIRAIRSRAASLATAALAGAIFCGIAFIAMKVIEYSSLIASGHDIQASPFYLYYFILTGVHLLHTVVGITILGLLTTQTRRTEISRHRMALIEGGGCFWHLVDVLWIALFALLYLIG
jgi:nitric oxide reductase NorE protein